jgi:hypothetical protein
VPALFKTCPGVSAPLLACRPPSEFVETHYVFLVAFVGYVLHYVFDAADSRRIKGDDVDYPYGFWASVI